jgi:hypothetical protein
VPRSWNIRSTRRRRWSPAIIALLFNVWSGHVLNQIVNQYDGWGNLCQEWQSHDGPVDNDAPWRGHSVNWDQDAPFRVDLSKRHPLLRIAGEAQKNRKDQSCPITPDFAEFLLATPEADRRGRVFRPMRKDGDSSPMREDTAGKAICDIGEKAGVVVARKATKDGEKVKYASAHDLRRSFGARWARRVSTATLMELMRHAEIATTMNYYATQNAENTADLLWAAQEVTPSNTFGNTTPQEGEKTPAAN